MCFQMISITDMTKAALEQLVPHRPICLGKTYADRTENRLFICVCEFNTVVSDGTIKTVTMCFFAEYVNDKHQTHRSHVCMI